MDSDLVSTSNTTTANSMFPASPSGQPPRRKPRIHPITARPHSRQRSRDIERGSPIYQSPNGANVDDSQTPWIWPDSATGDDARFTAGSTPGDSQFSIFAEPETLDSSVPTRDLPSMFVTGPCGKISPEDTWDKKDYNSTNKRPVNNRRQTDNSRSSTASGTSTSIFGRPRSSSYQRPPLRSTSSQNSSITGNSSNGRVTRNTNTRKASPTSQEIPSSLQDNSSSRTRTLSNATNTTDGDVSASELLDTLGDLEPVVNASNSNNNDTSSPSSATTRTGISTPGERAKDAQLQAMRKRSLSSEGERFSR